MKTLKVIFSIVGGLMLIGSAYMVYNTNVFLSNAVHETGRVVDLVESRSDDSITYAPVVAFRTASDEAIEFTSSTSSNPPSFAINEEVDVLFLPSDPHSAKINSFFTLWGGATILGGLGGVFFCVGMGMTLAGVLGQRKAAYLKEHGKSIDSEFVEVELNESVAVNDKNPYRIITEWTDSSTNQHFVFKSANLWQNPSTHIKGRNITVYIDKTNPKKYFMDTSFLPEGSN